MLTEAQLKCYRVISLSPIIRDVHVPVLTFTCFFSKIALLVFVFAFASVCVLGTNFLF